MQSRWSVLSSVGVVLLLGLWAMAGTGPEKPASKAPGSSPAKAESKAAAQPKPAAVPAPQQPVKKAGVPMPGMCGGMAGDKCPAPAQPAPAKSGKKVSPRGGVYASASSSSSPAAEKIRGALASLTTLEFVETPLSDVVNYLKDLHKIEIQLDQKALSDVGVASDTPITRNLKGVTLRSALNLMLADLDLTWVISNEVMLLTTRDRADGMLETVVYDVHDLVAARDEKGAPVNDFDGLIEVITSTVAVTSWDQVGGPASIAPFEGNAIAVLSVSQTQQAHEEIVKLLADLRKASHAKPGEPIYLRTVQPKPPMGACGSVAAGAAAGAMGSTPAPDKTPPKPAGTGQGMF